jgi:hypothetical protein
MPLHHLTIYTHHSLELAGKTSDKQHKSYASSKTNRGIGFSDIQEYLGTFKIEDDQLRLSVTYQNWLRLISIFCVPTLLR